MIPAPDSLKHVSAVRWDARQNKLPVAGRMAYEEKQVTKLLGPSREKIPDHHFPFLHPACWLSLCSLCFFITSQVFTVAIPSAMKVFKWTAAITFDTPMLYAPGFIELFTIGGVTTFPLTFWH